MSKNIFKIKKSFNQTLKIVAGYNPVNKIQIVSQKNTNNKIEKQEKGETKPKTRDKIKLS